GIRNKKQVYTINTSNLFTNQLLSFDKKNIEIKIKKRLQLIGINNPQKLSFHFWKYAYSDIGSSKPGYWNSNIGLGLCGDGFGLGKIDGALTSADFLSKQII
ncbi:hypothetical protein OAC91_03645, partial [Candidatus Marinimicrobia bacterium]|nr:hypothetical protein [Candidatus Neomarinimicrobiota bacterium]